VPGVWKDLPAEERAPYEASARAVDNTNNFRQVIAVARLFEAMTNLVVEYGVVIYYTRRLTAYVLTYSLRPMA